MQKDLLNEDYERISLVENAQIETEKQYKYQQEWEEEQLKLLKPAKIEVKYEKVSKISSSRSEELA